MQTQLSAADTALCDDIAVWLRHHLEATGAERFVLGLSGGIDSATVCALCVRAAGADRVLGAIMPAQSNPTDAEHATLVAQAFGVEIVRVDLTPVIGAFLAAMPAGSDPDVSAGIAGKSRPESRATLANANIKPRLRMTTLYYLANLHNGVVVGTGNKSEAMVGYFTKYGDGGVDLLPIADLYKHEVRRLARVLGVPEPIITKPPSAGLWAGQTDEAELGLSYEQLDAALAAIESGNTTGVDAAVRDRVQSLVNASAHKRQAIPTFRRLAPET
jgi:NAD+ synthase